MIVCLTNLMASHDAKCCCRLPGQRRGRLPAGAFAAKCSASRPTSRSVRKPTRSTARFPALSLLASAQAAAALFKLARAIV